MATVLESFEKLLTEGHQAFRSIGEQKPTWWKKKGLYRQQSRIGNVTTWDIYHSDPSKGITWLQILCLSLMAETEDEPAARSIKGYSKSTPHFWLADMPCIDKGNELLPPKPGVFCRVDNGPLPSSAEDSRNGAYILPGEAAVNDMSIPEREAFIAAQDGIEARLQAIGGLILGTSATFADAFKDIPLR